MDVVAPVIEDVYPLSPAQLEVFNRNRLAEERLAIHQVIYRLEGIDVGVFERAWQRLVDHHSMFRTSVQWEDLQRPVQVVQQDMQFTLDRYDWIDIPIQEQPKALGRFLEEDRQRGIALDRPPMFRVSVLQLTDKCAFFVWSFHPILLDHWSMSLALADLYQVYESILHEKFLLLMPAPRYRDYISWLRVQDPHLAEDFWRRSLGDLGSVTPLPLSRKASDNGLEESRVAVGLKLTSKLRAFSARHTVKVSTLVRAAWAIVLGCHSGFSEVVFGEVVSGRPTAIKGIQRTVGLFANTLPMRVKMPSREDSIGWLRALEEQEVQQRPFQHNNLKQILTWSSVAADRPLFESVLNLEKRPSSDVVSPSAGTRKLQTHARRTEAIRPEQPLVITVAPSIRSGLTLKAISENCRFQPGVGAHLLRDFRTVLARLVSRPRPRLDDLQRVVSPLIPIQSQGSEPPIFFVHPSGGNVVKYFQLAQELGSDQPVFAFEARGSQKRHHIQIEALATYYLAALRRLYPMGPYRLAGWSFGALVAFEMAQQALRQGQHVSQLALLDPPVVFDRKQDRSSSNEISLLLRFAKSHGIALRESMLARVPERQRVAFLLKRCKKADLVLPHTTLAEFRRQVQLFFYHTEAVKSYVPQRYPGRAILFLAEEGKRQIASNPAGDWENLSLDLELHRIPGSHQTMLQQPHLKVLLEKLRDSLHK